ncbi:MAG TPA: Gfo/Idh/MocA family oxidoreductase [Thermoanaerobaculia bacterium]|nr:Gfo/Idh/MocA family oxidoreductase [Thermoanaerobaculia bacterium]
MAPRVAMIGTGWSLRVQTSAFREAGIEVAALWSRSEEKARRFAAERGIPLGTSELREILEHPEIDLVSVTTPPHTHRELSLAALAAGKHVLCEKPFALDAAEAAQMAAAARARPDRLALVDHELRFLPVHRRFRELLADDFAGPLYHVEINHHSPGRLDPDIPFDWWSERAKGGGYWGALGSHYVDLLHWLVAAAGRYRIAAASASLQPLIPERRDADGLLRPVTADEEAMVRLRLEDEDGRAVPVLLHLSAGVAAPPPHRIQVAGARGTLRYEGQRLLGQRVEPGARRREVADFTPEPGTGPVDGRDDDWARGSVHLGRALRDALDTGDGSSLAGLAATFDDGLRTQRTLDAARASSDAEGAWVGIG